MRGIDFSSWLGKVVWVAGLVLLILGRNYLDEQVLLQLRLSSESTFLYSGIIFLIPFLSGMYLSILFLWCNIKVNDASLLFLVAIPSVILAICPLVLEIITIPLEEWIQWLILTLNKDGFLTLVAGVTLLPSLSYRKKAVRGRRY